MTSNDVDVVACARRWFNKPVGSRIHWAPIEPTSKGEFTFTCLCGLMHKISETFTGEWVCDTCGTSILIGLTKQDVVSPISKMIE